MVCGAEPIFRFSKSCPTLSMMSAVILLLFCAYGPLSRLTPSRSRLPIAQSK